MTNLAIFIILCIVVFLFNSSFGLGMVAGGLLMYFMR